MSLPKAVVDRLNQGPIGTLLKGIGAGTVGAADELAFGALSQGWLGKYVADTTKRIQEENPMTTTAGAVASNFVPVLGLANKGAKAFKIGRKAFSAGNHALKAYQNSSVAKLLSKIPQSKLAGLMEENPYFIGSMSRMMGSAAKGAGQSVASGEATHALRRLTGANQSGTESQDADRIASEITFGAGAGLLGKMLRSAAPTVYNHPGIIDEFDKTGRTEQQAKELMDRGVFGSLRGAFKKEADEMKNIGRPQMKAIQDRFATSDDSQARIFNSMMPGTTNLKGTIPVKMVHKRALNDVESNFALSEKEKNALLKEYGDLASQLKTGQRFRGLNQEDYTGARTLEKALKDINTELMNKKALQKAQAAGLPGIGDATNPIDVLNRKKQLLEDMQHINMRKQLGKDVRDRFEEARQIYGQGKAIDTNRIGYELGLGSRGKDYFYSDALRNALASSVNSAPVRTGLGVLLNKSTERNLGHLAGRRQERVSRKEINDTEPYLSGFDRLMERLGEPGEAEKPADDQTWMKPPSKEAQRESGKKFGFNEDVLAVINDPAGSPPDVMARSNKRLDDILEDSKKKLRKQKKEAPEEPEEDFDYEKAFDEIGRE